jgi:hypothetical protein
MQSPRISLLLLRGDCFTRIRSGVAITVSCLFPRPGKVPPLDKDSNSPTPILFLILIIWILVFSVCFGFRASDFEFWESALDR